MRLLLIHQKHVTDLLTAISERCHENDRIPETVTGSFAAQAQSMQMQLQS